MDKLKFGVACEVRLTHGAANAARTWHGIINARYALRVPVCGELLILIPLRAHIGLQIKNSRGPIKG